MPGVVAWTRNVMSVDISGFVTTSEGLPPFAHEWFFGDSTRFVNFGWIAANFRRAWTAVMALAVADPLQHRTVVVDREKGMEIGKTKIDRAFGLIAALSMVHSVTHHRDCGIG
jgi:hypothetical protein